jgi:DNA-binding transcriptional MerR regulator
MKSQWFEYKERAITLRKQGLSLREIEALLSIPRSTLSGWLKEVPLSDAQKTRLKQNSDIALIKARVKASDWHRSQKELRLQRAQEEAQVVLKNIKIDENIIELALAMLYLGEGAKQNTTAIGNSNPLILKFFLSVLLGKYQVNPVKIKCDLHIRADQNPEELKKYWSKELNLPLSNFRSVMVDIRTTGRTSYPNYKGVCLINCGSIAIQRKLISLYNLFCQKVIEDGRLAQLARAPD